MSKKTVKESKEIVKQEAMADVPEVLPEEVLGQIRRLNDGEQFPAAWENYEAVNPPMVALRPGEYIEGTFIGLDTYEAPDPQTGEVKTLVATIIRISPGAAGLIRLPDSYQMRKAFGTLASDVEQAKAGVVPQGRRVFVLSEGQGTTKKGRRMNAYRIGFLP